MRVIRNYALPDDARPTEAQVAELVAVFTSRSRTPRLEFLPGLCPDVEPGLLAAGFVPERRLTVMSCPPARPQRIARSLRSRLVGCGAAAVRNL